MADGNERPARRSRRLGARRRDGAADRDRPGGDLRDLHPARPRPRPVDPREPSSAPHHREPRRPCGPDRGAHLPRRRAPARGRLTGGLAARERADGHNGDLAETGIESAVGEVTGRIAPGTIGEVMIAIRGGREAFHAYAFDTGESWTSAPRS